MTLIEGAAQHGFTAGAAFVGPDTAAEVAVIIVTYNSAADIDSLITSLRREAKQTRLRVIVADNHSADGTLEIVGLHSDVIGFSTSGNIGYAAGINAARQHLGDAESVLILNPDLVVEPGAVRALLDRVEYSAAGVVVPRILEDSGATYESLRREPTLTRAIGDALFGSRFTSRPGWLSEMVYDEGASYGTAHVVEWATGAALLIRRDVADLVGGWDERFFLYSEEVDYFRRVRDAGEVVWFDPEAVVRHSQGGSGTSTALMALMTVNRIRYIEKGHGAVYTAAYRAAVVLHELLRSYQPAHRTSLGFVANRKTWRFLPRATGAVE
ncbi:glycosyltransferase family 2 protein [Mycetocola zhadangensis]|uniref:Glycosyltransferase family 2 protein n=1 Tax=Mycetocola zhadangensis TaxID=1164595 RepID=A0A3L7J2D4_9MICO|nr:glycosyltransferase family 2 protein [Mycetocola zhadangensis]RLQ84579.1 glycosyltransferase family 2 protein [Mycetocola zhadangensis]GGE91694.1 glycosyl transferase [Mycetocola zhadangensis]